MIVEMDQKRHALAILRNRLQEGNPDLNQIIDEARQYNPWFTPKQVRTSIRNICDVLLDPDSLRLWTEHYKLPVTPATPRKIGLVMAGNIPLVGFHDFLCVWISGHKAVIKLSEKDNRLLPYILDELVKINLSFASDWEIVERLSGFDAVIATGSNNSSRYFEAYFGAYPHIIRKNRNGVAVLDGQESQAQLTLLAEDMLTYFGLGCRNVSKILVPEGYDFKPLLDVFESYPELHDHNRYRNNVDYQYALVIMNLEPHHTQGNILFRPSTSLLSPMATVFYEEYRDQHALKTILDRDLEEIQCVISDLTIPGVSTIPFGRSQHPGLTEYADGVDVMEFLIQLHQNA